MFGPTLAVIVNAIVFLTGVYVAAVHLHPISILLFFAGGIGGFISGLWYSDAYDKTLKARQEELQLRLQHEREQLQTPID